MFDYPSVVHHILLAFSCILNSAAILYNARTIYKIQKELDKWRHY